MVFPVVMYGCESWTVKNAECRRSDAFELWCWRRLLRVPWAPRRSNQSILKEISPEYSLEGLMLKLKLQYFGYLMQRTDSLEKTLMLGKTEGRRRRGWQDEMVGWDHWPDGHGFGWTPGVGDGQGGLACCSPWGHKESDMIKQLNWTELNWIISRQDYHLSQPCPSEEKQTNKQKLSTNLTLYEAYTNHWTNLRRAETKRKKEFNLEACKKETSNTIS